MSRLYALSPVKLVLLSVLLLTLSFYVGTFWQQPVERRFSPEAVDQEEVLDKSRWLPNEIGLVKRPKTLLGTPDGVMYVCPANYTEYIPCLDPVYTLSLNTTGDLTAQEAQERHCEPAEDRPFCLVPPPPGYKVPVPWPESRDRVYLNNVNHTKLTEKMGKQNWLLVNGSYVEFPGGGTQFTKGAAEYIQRIGDAITRLGNLKTVGVVQVLDVGCGVASFGAYLLPLGIKTMSFAPLDDYENQLQFVLERGLPGIIEGMNHTRLPYPSRAFEMVHCSRCGVGWHLEDGLLLKEVDRLLRPRGFFVYSAPPVYNSRRPFKNQWDIIANVTSNMCWKLISQDAQTAIWRKTSSRKCQLQMQESGNITLCQEEDADKAWKRPVQNCIYLSEEYGEIERLPPWPDRLTYFPRRISKVSNKYTEEKYNQDTVQWQKNVADYLEWMNHSVIRNVLDMNAIVGGFAAALVKEPVWVMNVVPVGMKNTLPVIYDRGLLGVAHDWAEPFSTYPRTYDLIHAFRLFSTLLKKRPDKVGVQVVDLMLEMDRMLRPKGFVIIRDSASYVQQAADLAPNFLWKATTHNIYVDGQVSEHELILVCRKQFWIIQ